MNRRAPLALCAAAFGLLIVAALAPAARGDGPSADAFTGHWRYGSGEAGRQRVDDAVDEAVSGFAFFLRPVAEGRVEARVGPFEDLWFRQNGDRLSFTADDWGPTASRLGGPARTIEGPDGSDLELTQRITPDGELVQVFRHDEARRRNTLRVSGDGQRLVFHTQLGGPRLERASYRLRYRLVEDF